VEAAAIMGVMSRNPNRPANELLQQINGWPLLPRKIFPASLTPVKDALSHTLAATASTTATAASTNGAAAAAILSSAAAGDLAAAQAAAAAASPLAVTAAPPGLSKELEKALDDIEAAAAGRAGPAVQEPPTKPKTGPIKPKEKLSKTPKGLGGSVLRPPAEKQQQREQQHSRREKELADRKAYLKNFWYAAGKTGDASIGAAVHAVSWCIVVCGCCRMAHELWNSRSDKDMCNSSAWSLDSAMHL
jgi:hypothetical protein